ncbi:COX15/CtaA family protein [Neobacillus sp. D3-1R]|uniref:COX15/CtaA family protein n=1 Tax=Neobacillus sp. D3-1R TaxID=3445778 RepID=UPI003FA01CB7
MPIKRLAFVSIIITYILIVFGGYVASSNSGMGCGPDWPLCNGLVIPILKGATLIEFTHRIIGAILGLLTIFLFISVLRKHGLGKIRNVAWTMLFLLTIQVLLGAVVVVLDTPAIVVSIHLLIAMFFLYSLLWISKNSAPSISYPNVWKESNLPQKINLHLKITMGLLVLTLAFGAYIKHLSYGLACGWLICGEIFLPISTPELLQTIHRGLGVVSAVYILLLAFGSILKNWDKSIRKRLIYAALIVMLQLIIGILTVVTSLHLPWAVLHLAVGTAVFFTISEAQIYVSTTTAKTTLKVGKVGKFQS